ncbi:MAG: hemolysin family protein [Nocardioides sp.]|jgi:CBS domain containing-hemolysin-like protein
MSTTAVIAATVAILAASAFFVAIEFALLAARRHRLEERAHTSTGARAALRSAADLTLVLAGAQLGITVCTLALGAITKPAVHHWLMPPLESVGLPVAVADVASFILALFVVTFLHLVVGEMAPKSWAIAHPERSATLLALPMRGFMWATRPLLLAMNNSANRILRALGIEPVDELAAAQSPEGLRALVEHSANVGALQSAYRAPIESAIELRSRTVADLLDDRRDVAAVSTGATVAQLQEATLDTHHLRILIREQDGTIAGMVHVRDTLDLDPDHPVQPLVRDLLRLDINTALHEALRQMRETSSHIAAVVDDAAESVPIGHQTGGVLGVVTLTDILSELIPAA